MIKVIVNNKSVEFDEALAFMDDDIVDGIHRTIAVCSDDEFTEMYCILHKKKYGNEFRVEKDEK